MAMTTQTKKIAGATTALVLLTALNFVNYIDRYILPAVQEQVKHEFLLSDAQIGSLTMWFMVAYIAISPVTGWLGDRFPRKHLIVVCALLIAACNFFTAHVTSFGSLNFRHAMLGIGEASFGIFAPALLADFYASDKRNRVMTIFNIALPVGSAIGYLTGGLIGHSHGWRTAFVISAIPGAIIGILILFFLREPERMREEVTGTKPSAGVGSLLRNPAYLCAILGYAAVTFSIGGISVWMPSFLQRMNGYDEAQAAGVMGPIIVVAGLGGTVVGGIFAERWLRRTSKALYYVPALGSLLTVPVALASFFGPRSITLPALSVAIFFHFLGTGPVNAATLNSVPATLRAMAMAGQLLVIHLLGDTFSPAIIGGISDRSNLRIGLAATLITYLLGAGIFYIGARYASSSGQKPVEAAA